MMIFMGAKNTRLLPKRVFPPMFNVKVTNRASFSLGMTPCHDKARLTSTKCAFLL